MGNIRKVLLVFILLNSLFSNSQIIKIENHDSIKLIKSSRESEFNLIIYNKENIDFNKKHNYNYQKLAGGIQYCEKCKKETLGFIIKKVKTIPAKKYKCYTVSNLQQNVKKYSFGGGYFLIKGIYYKNLGIPIE